MEPIVTRTARLWIDDEGILHGLYNSNAEETLDDAKENVAAAQKLAAGKKYLVLIDMSAMRLLRKEARDYYSGPEVARYTTAQALITASPVSRLIGNFFLGLNKPPHPVRLFGNEEDALVWLRSVDV